VKNIIRRLFSRTRGGESYIEELKMHVEKENPVLKEVVEAFETLDAILRRLGYFHREDSLTKKMSWWPVISVLGTYSAGKSSFINFYLDYPLQETGVQAVDDKFTVICYSPEKQIRILPGFALDSDPRFPFYKISSAIEQVSPGEGAYLDSYLQLKTCPSPALKGKIIIDSPGFDADEKRGSVLRITDRIIDLSDLVLIFFDARHPEPGSMKDTLEHLVKTTVKRRDANKFLYILNQMDVTAREDNLEAVFASWQRALVRYGVSAGKYFCIYNPHSCVVIEDEEIRRRYERKRDEDLKAIFERIEQVKVERVYRLVALVKYHVEVVEEEILPVLKDFRDSLRRRIFLWEGMAMIIFFAAFWGISALISSQGLFHSLFHTFSVMFSSPLYMALSSIVLMGVFGLHLMCKKKVGESLKDAFLKEVKETKRPYFARAFEKNIRWWSPVFFKASPVGWSKECDSLLDALKSRTREFIQRLNREFTNPSGYVPLLPGKDREIGG